MQRPQPQQQFPQSGPPRQLYAAPPPPSQVWNPPPQWQAGPPNGARPTPPPQQQPAWGPPPPRTNPQQPGYGPAFRPPMGPQPPMNGRPPMMGPPPMNGRPPMGSPQMNGRPPMGGRPPMMAGGRPPMMEVQPKHPQRHVGPSGPDGTWLTNDLVAEPEIMLNEEQRKIWKSFDNKEIDRDGIKLSFYQRVKQHKIDWNKWANDQKKWKNIKQWIFAAIMIALSVVLLLEQKHIINALKSPTQHLKNMNLGWLIPAGILFVLSFPPLFGAEIIVIIIAVTWSIWASWGITTLGTFVGEVTNYFLWKLIMKKRQTKAENGSVYWMKLSRVSKQGGFWMCLAIRYSMIPTHLSTTLFAACGISFPVYLISTLLSQPRWLFHVFVGRAYGTTESNTEKLIFGAVSLAFGISTQLAMKWINKKSDACDPEVKQILRQRRADALNAARTHFPSAKGGAMYRMEKMGHKANDSTASFASSSDTVVGSTENLDKLKDGKK